MSEPSSPYPVPEANALAEALNSQVEHLTGCLEGSHEEKLLDRTSHALAVFEAVKNDESDDRRWAAVILIHDAAVLMADHLEACQYVAGIMDLEGAISAFKAARESDEGRQLQAETFAFPSREEDLVNGPREAPKTSVRRP
jgi:hypothetical protein